jgi:hypothetical protein
MKKNVASQVIGAQLIAKADGTPVTSGTTTCYVTGDGGTQGAGSVGSGACTHEGNGFWTYTPSQAETNFDHVAFTFVNSLGINVTVQLYPNFPQTGDAFNRLGAPAGASIAADLAAIDDFIDTEVAAIKAKTDNLPSDPADHSVVIAATDAILAAVGSVPTANANADALLDRAAGVETGYTLRQAMRLLLSVLAGKASGLGTTTAVFRDMADSKDRVTATVDADGNRSAVTRDAT